MLIKFNKEQFEDGKEFPKGWHLVNNASSQQGEYTLCGVAFDGDAVSTSQPDFKGKGKVTCKFCVSVIKLCRGASI